MRRMLALAGIAAMAGAGAAHAGATTRIDAKPARDGWFVCDAVSGPYAGLVGKPGLQGRSVITLLDRRTGRLDTQSYDVGPADPGAGNIHWSLSQGGKEVGNVHGINPGMVDGASFDPMMGLTIGKAALECRWVRNMRFLGLDSRRSVMVTQEAGVLVYRTFDYARRGAKLEPDGAQVSNAPTLRIAGGRETADGFRFANKGFTYMIARNGAGPATLTVSKGARIVQAERLAGYGIAPSAAPGRTVEAFDARAVWTGKGLEACRAGSGGPDKLRGCLLQRMKADGATSQAIGFAYWLGARKAGDLGYMSGWRQAGPVGVAEISYPFRANTNGGTALVPSDGDPILVDDYAPTPEDKARPDYRTVMTAHPDAWPVAPADVSAAKVAPGAPITLHARTRLSTCHACAPVGRMTVAYRFDPAGHFLSSGVERVE